MQVAKAACNDVVITRFLMSKVSQMNELLALRDKVSKIEKDLEQLKGDKAKLKEEKKKALQDGQSWKGISKEAKKKVFEL